MTLAARIAVLLIVGACIAAVTASRARTSFDLAALLPAADTAAQEVLKERFGVGPGAQAIYAVLPNASFETTAAVVERLNGIPSITRVLSATDELAPDSIPSILWDSQFLLADLPTDTAAWRKILEDRLADIALADEELLRLIVADPLLATVGAFADVTGGTAQYGEAEGQYLVVLTSVPAFDAGGQARLVEAIRGAVSQAGAPDARLYGPGVYTADLQATVRFEATLFSIMAAFGLTCLLFWWFRSWTVVVAIATPMLVGTAVGYSVVALAYDEIHGIAVAFGFTLLGITVDYPLHVFSHPSRPDAVWPTLRIGVASTLIAYGVFHFGGSPALAQLGTFAIFGVTAAALATAWLSQPGRRFLMGQHDATAVPGRAPRLRLPHWPWVVTLSLAVPLLLLRPVFSDDLSTLTPVAPDILAADAELREKLGASDMRHLVVVRAGTLERALERSEAVAARLDRALASGALSGYQHVGQFLPSRQTQRRRQAAVRAFLADGGTRPGSAFAQAADALGFAPDAFHPFQERLAAASASRGLLTRDAVRRDPDLAVLLDTHLYRAGDVWKSLVFLRDVADTATIAHVVAELPGVAFLDLKTASTSLVSQFRQRLLGVLGVSLLVIAGAVLALTRSVRRTVWISGTVATALAVAATGAVYLRGGISPFDLMSLALVAGLSLDYGLFFSKHHRSAEDMVDTGRAVLICATSSLLVFCILSLSSIPVLRSLGSTVAVGVLAGYLLTRLATRYGALEHDATLV